MKRNMHPNSLANLRPVQLGDPARNPHGPRRRIPDLDKLLAEVLGERDQNGLEAAQVILMALRARATKGDVRAAEQLLDRAYGKPKQPITVANESVTIDFRDAE